MDAALNKVLAALPDDTKVFVSRSHISRYRSSTNHLQPGHEYTKGNVKFGIKVMQSEPIKKLESFAMSNKQTQGKFTIGDEKQHNVFMRLEVSLVQSVMWTVADHLQDPTVQKFTGKTDRIGVMAALREAKNSM